MRYEQRPEYGFDGRISEDGALAVGEYQLVSLNRLIREARKTKAGIDAAGNPINLDLKTASMFGADGIYLDELLGEIACRNYKRVNKRMSRTNSGGRLLKRVAQLRFLPENEDEPAL